MRRVYLWYYHERSDDQERLVHRQVRAAANALSILHLPHYPWVRSFDEWREIIDAVQTVQADVQDDAFVYVLLFGPMTLLKKGGKETLRIGSLALAPEGIQRVICRASLHLHMVWDATLHMEEAPTNAKDHVINLLKQLESEGVISFACPIAGVKTRETGSGLNLEEATSMKPGADPRSHESALNVEEDASSEPAADPRSYYTPKLHRFTEVYFRSLVEAVCGGESAVGLLQELVNLQLQAACVAAVQLRLRYQPPPMELLVEFNRPPSVEWVPAEAKQSIVRKYAFPPPLSPCAANTHPCAAGASPASVGRRVVEASLEGETPAQQAVAPSAATAQQPSVARTRLNPQASLPTNVECEEPSQWVRFTVRLNPQPQISPSQGKEGPLSARPVNSALTAAAQAPNVSRALAPASLREAGKIPQTSAALSVPSSSSAKQDDDCLLQQSSTPVTASTQWQTATAREYGLQELWGEPKSTLRQTSTTNTVASSPLPFKGADSRLSQVATKELARRFTAGLKGMVLHVGAFAPPVIENGQKKCPLCGVEIPEALAWVDHVLTERHLQVVGDPLPHAQYYCYVCSAIVSGDKNLTLHLGGARHRRKLESGKPCGIGGCQMLCFNDTDRSSHEIICHSH